MRSEASIALIVALGAQVAAPALGQAPVTTLRDIERDIRELRGDMKQQQAALDRRVSELTAQVRKLTAEVERLRNAMPSGLPAVTDSAAGPQAVTVQVSGNDWGQFALKDMELVLRSAAEALMTRLPTERLGTVVVRRGADGAAGPPERGTGGEHVVVLSPRDGDWADVVHQFVRQLWGILMSREGERPDGHLWFRRALGEAAAISVLKGLCESWKAAPPQPYLSRHVPQMQRHVQEYLKDGNGPPPEATLAQWYDRNREDLAKGKVGPEGLAVAARALLPLLEAQPPQWQAVLYLGLGEPDAAADFHAYLRSWYEHAPRRHKAFVWKVLGLFGAQS